MTNVSQSSTCRATVAQRCRHSYVSSNALGWMDERKCQGAAGICDESKTDTCSGGELGGRRNRGLAADHANGDR